MCKLEPERVCKCCQLNRPCAYKLMLGPKERAQLARLAWLIDCDPWIVPAPLKSAARSQAREHAEPVASTPCGKCGVAFQMLEFLVEFLKLRGIAAECEGCR